MMLTFYDYWMMVLCFACQNKSAFLCGVMKTYRQREKQGTKVSDTNKGPDEAKIKVRTNPVFQKLCWNVICSWYMCDCSASE